MTDNVQPEEYRVVLQAVPEEAVDAVAWELMLLFPLDRGPALQVVRAAPIVLVDKLDAAALHNVETYMGALRRFGAEIVITSEVDTAMKRLNWPRMPHMTRHPANVIICPNCGVRLSVEAVAARGQAATQPVPEPVRQPAAPQQQAPPPPQSPPATPQPAAVATEQPAEDDAPLRLIDDTSDEATAGENAESDQAPKPTGAKPAGTWKLVEDEEQPASAPKPAASLKPSGQPEAPPQTRQPRVVQPPKQFKPVPQLKENRPFAANGAKSAASRAADSNSNSNDNTNNGGHGNCRVSLVKKLKPTERKPVAALIAKYQGISLEEAQKATSKSVVTILRNATKEQAEECRRECKALGFNVQVME